MSSNTAQHNLPLRYWTDAERNPLFESMDLQIAALAVTHLSPSISPALRENARFLFAECHRLARLGHLLMDLRQGSIDLPEPPVPLPDRACMEHLHQTLPESFNESGANPIVWETPDQIYLRRLWRAERETARWLARQAEPFSPPSDSGGPSLVLPTSLTKAQIAACEAALTQRLVLLSGGPGTGKTFTIFQILRRVLQCTPAARIQLLAPTGKAVARMQESLRSALQSHDPSLAHDLQARLQSATLHRYLRAQESELHRYSMFPRPREAADLVIVDEASMVDLTLLHRLLRSLEPNARLILMGDRFQLASVQPGSVFADTCEAFENHSMPPFELQAPFRFASGSSLHALCEAIRAGETTRAIQCLASDPEGATVRHIDPADSAAVDRAIRLLITERVLPAAMETDPSKAIQLHTHTLVLSAQNHGPMGIQALNALLTRHSRHHALQAHSSLTPGFFWKPIMIRRNDPVLGLFNGDVGVAQHFLSPQFGEQGVAWFSDSAGALRSHAVHLLPDHSDAFACTVHKSQGSEAEEVLLLLPGEPNPILTRELLYTAVSRARKRVTLIASEAILRHCIETPTRRNSLLKQRILQELNPLSAGDAAKP